MQLAIISLLTGLIISAVAIYYSVVGLTAIFAAAAIPIMVMGVALEVAKLVATVWLKQNWKIAPFLIKTYLVSAVAVLMFITSMGIFGFLSKAHMDQNLVSGDVQSKIAVYDEKIKTAKDNIDANRKALKQMDEAVDQVMGRSTDEKGAEKAVAIRRGQQKERARLQSEIAAEQKTINTLTDERAPIAAEVRKVEAEVGPIKYIASFVYGDNPDANILEKAVTWVIVIIVFVFDPLAVILLLASQYSFAQHFKLRRGEVEYEEQEKETPLTWAERIANKIKAIRTSAVDSFDTIKHSIKSPIVHKKLDEPVILAEPTPVEEVVDLDYVNQQLAEAVVVEEQFDPIEVSESVDFDELKNKLAVFREALTEKEKTEFKFAEFNPTIKGFTVPKVDNVAPLANITAVKFDNNDLVIPDNLEEMTDSQIKQWNDLLEKAERAVLEEKPEFPKDPFLGQQFNIGESVYIYNGTSWIYTPKSGEQTKFQLIPELEKHIEDRKGYVQNEEQIESNLWQETRNNVRIENAHSLSQEDYQEKVQHAIVRDLVEQINNNTISIDDLTEAETIAVEAYLRKESDAG